MQRCMGKSILVALFPHYLTCLPVYHPYYHKRKHVCASVPSPSCLPLSSFSGTPQKHASVCGALTVFIPRPLQSSIHTYDYWIFLLLFIRLFNRYSLAYTLRKSCTPSRDAAGHLTCSVYFSIGRRHECGRRGE